MLTYAIYVPGKAPMHYTASMWAMSYVWVSMSAYLEHYTVAWKVQLIIIIKHIVLYRPPKQLITEYDAETGY